MTQTESVGKLILLRVTVTVIQRYPFVSLAIPNQRNRAAIAGDRFQPASRDRCHVRFLNQDRLWLIQSFFPAYVLNM